VSHVLEALLREKGATMIFLKQKARSKKPGKKVTQ